MRSKRYVTMLDPFQQRYGQLFTTAILVPALISDILCAACILAALGGMMSIVLDVSSTISIIISAAVSIIYTLFGGLYAVAYTDIIQLSFIVICLWVCVPFMFLSPAVTDAPQTPHFNQSSFPSWIGEVKLEDAGKWTDDFLVLSVGGLAFQALFQRILAASSSTRAQVTCFAAGGLTFFLGIPSMIIGALATSADWNQTDYGLPPPYERGEAGNVLPLALSYITPSWMSVLGIGAVAAAVMSSMDSVMLSSASMFTQNIYKTMLRKQASERELQWVIRISVLLVGLAGTGLAFNKTSIVELWLLTTDLLYCLVAPQLVCVVHLRSTNCYGAISGYVIALLLRALSGEPALGLPSVLLYPGWRQEDGVIRQYFPFKTLIVLISFAAINLVSWLFQLAFTRHLIPQSWDVMNSFKKKIEAEVEEERPISNENKDFVLSTAL
ncbi:high-affinity choline transporter 1-like isoform X2 [Syngnathoides biaculeatus]|nr:high-affinity choline transporter 1-like isoform X2 [Syngnathoides biaculeatus]